MNTPAPNADQEEQLQWLISFIRKQTSMESLALLHRLIEARRRVLEISGEMHKDTFGDPK